MTTASAASTLALAGLLGALSPASAAAQVDTANPALPPSVAPATQPSTSDLSTTVPGQPVAPLRPILGECRKQSGREDCRIALAVYFKVPVTGTAVVIDGKLASLQLRFALDHLDALLSQLKRVHGVPTTTTPFLNDYRQPVIRYGWDRTAVGAIELETLVPYFSAGSLMVYDPTQLRRAEEELEDW